MSLSPPPARDVLRSALAWMGRSGGARFVSIALAVALAVQIVGIIRVVVSTANHKLVSRHLAGERSVVATPDEHGSASFAAAAVAAHLFGLAPVASASATKPRVETTATPLVLTGTIWMGNPARGFAILGKDATSTRLYAAGSPVSGGVTLRQVFKDHAVIDRGGELATLWMPRYAGPTPGTRWVAAGASGAGLVRTVLPRMEPAVEERLSYENDRVGSAFTETALTDNGEFRQLVVQPGPDPSVLEQMGLKPGDVIMGVDNITLDLDHLDLLRQHLASGRQIHLSVIRPQQGPLDVEVDSAQYQGWFSN